MATFGEWTENNKKKKKKKSTGKASFSDYTKALQEEEELGPVKEEKSWFQSGEFEDGYQFGDVTKAILGTVGDGLEDLLIGAAGMGEKALDALLYAAPLVAEGEYYQNGGVYQNPIAVQRNQEIFDSMKASNAEIIAKDLYNEEEAIKTIISKPIKKSTGFDIEESSVFGSKMDSLAQSGGQLVGTAVLNPVVPWFVTTGMTSFGSEAENALNQGASYEEAGLSAAVTAGAEILTEKLSGGIKFGGKTLDDAMTHALATRISNKVVRNGGKLVMDMLGEGGEEVISSFFSNLGSALYKEEDLGEILFSEEAVDEYVDSFIGGGILGGVSSTGKVVKSSMNGTDAVTGLTKNEQTVFDKVYKATIAEQEADGKKLTQKEKSKLYDATMNALEKGYIDTDTIESTLGGENYANYKSLTEKKSELQKEYDTLYQMKNMEKSDAQIDRQAELKLELSDIQKRIDTLKGQVDSDRASYTQGSKLAESYNEQARKEQEFEADLDSYTNESAKQTVKNFMEHTKSNNTNRTHDYLDFLTRISEDRGYVFDFTTTEQLQASIENGNQEGIDVDPSRVEAYVSGKNKTIVINMDAKKSLNSLAGHEIVHTLEGFGEYDGLQEAVFKLAETKGEFADRLASVQRRYKNLSEDAQNKELTSDLLGDYLFTDYDFIKSLSAEKPNIFKRIYNEIKYLCKMATTGSQELRELERVKHQFEKIWREGRQNTDATNSDVKLSLADSDGNQLTKGQQEFFKNSKVRDENGNLMVVYHGSKDYGFTVFDTGKTGDGTSLFFTNSEDMANSYVNDKSKLYKTYLNLENPYVVDAKGHKWNQIRLNDSTDELTGKVERYVDLAMQYDEAIDFALVVESLGSMSDSVDYLLQEEAEYGDESLYTDEEKAEMRRLASELDYAYENWDEEAHLDEDGEPTDLQQYLFSHKSPTTYTTRQIANIAKKQGNDGVIIKNVYDNGKHSIDTGIRGFGNVYIAFDSNQIKDVDNVNPTKDADIRFSLSETVEETKDLIAVHNLGTAQLLKTLELGGFPMPSIAITKDDYSHNEYGEISILFGKETIDPHFFRSNKVYGGDAWTPVYPKIEYEVNDKVQRAISEKYYELHNKIPSRFDRTAYRLVSDLEDMINREGGEAGLIESLKNDYGMKQFFLAETGTPVEDVITSTTTEMTEAEKEMCQYFLDNERELVESYKQNRKNPQGFLAWTKENAEKLENAYRKYLKNEFDFTEDKIHNVLENTKLVHLKRFISDAVRYEETGGITTKEEYDSTATHDAIDKAVDQAKYEEWLNALLKGVEKSSGIRNNVDYFTNSGNRRSFKALHYENTLENVVKVMKAQDNGQAFISGLGIWGVSAKDYGSIAEIKADSSRLEHRDASEYSAMKQEYGDRLTEIANKIVDKNHYNQFIAMDNAMENIVDAVRKSKRPSDIARYLEEYHQISNPLEVAQEIVDLVTDISNMPTEYFEAKPQRAVGLDEIATVILPKDADEKLKAALSERNIPYVEYDGTAEDRLAKLNGEAIAKDKKFSLSEQGRGYAPIGTYNVYGKDIALQQDIAPVKEAEYESIKPEPVKQPKTVRADKVPTVNEEVAKIMVEEPEVEKKKSRFFSRAMGLVADKGFVFENLAKKTKNRNLESKFNFIRYADGMAQDFIGNGTDGVRPLKDIQAEVQKAGLTEKLYEYVYHKHNIDRMSLENRYDDVPNKAVFGDSVTSEISQETVDKLEAQYPALKQYANEIYAFNNHLRQMLVDGGVISQETADLWQEMYPHYVPIRRAGDFGLNINVPLDTGRTGVNAPVKRAVGGNQDILPLFDTMAQRAFQTYKAVAKNRFGVELKNTLGTTVETEAADVDGIIEGIETQDELLQKGENGRSATFTVFDKGEKVTFEITDEMYDALKPTNEILAQTYKIPNTISNVHRGLLTEYNPVFTVRNIIKDAQDVLINSQHPAQTYKNFPKAVKEMVTGGEWFAEYARNGGEQNTYFDKETNTFAKEKSGLSKVIGLPFEAISKANNFIERLPRLAEYIASRESGRGIEESMLDAARVTTNFAAGGDLTKWLNRNGATFLNASVQGAMQQVRNVRDAKMNGLKGWTQLAAKYAVAGLPVVLLNGLLWDDDEEYAELSDYVKQNYYIVAKYDDGKFVRIPKGRTLAVIQNAMEQVVNGLTGNDEVDLGAFLELAVSNLAPNNPLENNILAPVIQVAKNKTWYGDDLVPTRLQDLPPSEQSDESTDSISKWLGEKMGVSPYKINYLLDQYSGGLGDTFLPMLTPEAESGDDSFLGNMIAPIKGAFTTDSVMNNQNVSDFYDTSDTLTMNAKKAYATDEDVLSNKYFNSVKAEVGKLYGEKREIQNSDLSDAEKYYLVREVQKKIDALTKEGLGEYENVNIDGVHATVGDLQYHKTDDGWEKITDKQLEKQDDVTSGLGISPSEYWSKKDEYDLAYESPEKYEIAQKVGGYDAYMAYREGMKDMKLDEKVDYVASLDLTTEQKNALINGETTRKEPIDLTGYEAYGDLEELDYATKNPGKYAVSRVIGDYETFTAYADKIGDFRADQDSDGKSIPGSAKAKKKDYIFSLDLDYGQKALLYRMHYDSQADKAEYNPVIVEYLDSRNDVSLDEMIEILEELDMKWHSDGTVTW